MKCPKCEGKSRIAETRQRANNSVYRRRWCLRCEHRWSLTEVPREAADTLKDPEIQTLRKTVTQLRQELRQARRACAPSKDLRKKLCEITEEAIELRAAVKLIPLLKEQVVQLNKSIRKTKSKERRQSREYQKERQDVARVTEKLRIYWEGED